VLYSGGEGENTGGIKPFGFSQSFIPPFKNDSDYIAAAFYLTIYIKHWLDTLARYICISLHMFVKYANILYR
jgi:hypothetical protein